MPKPWVHMKLNQLTSMENPCIVTKPTSSPLIYITPRIQNITGRDGKSPGMCRMFLAFWPMKIAINVLLVKYTFTKYKLIVCMYFSGEKDQSWRYHLDGKWFEDETVTLLCDGTTTTSVYPSTTSDGPTITTPKPQPGDKQRTIIFVEKVRL